MTKFVSVSLIIAGFFLISPVAAQVYDLPAGVQIKNNITLEEYEQVLRNGTSDQDVSPEEYYDSQDYINFAERDDSTDFLVPEGNGQEFNTGLKFDSVQEKTRSNVYQYHESNNTKLTFANRVLTFNQK
jgi:hypothetical protein